MKLLFFLWLTFGIQSVFGATDYSVIDAFAKDIRPLKGSAGLESLTKKLTRSFKTDEEKARAILAWIVYNIDYDTYRAKNENKTDVFMQLEIQQNPETGQDYISGAQVKEVSENGDTIDQTLKTRLGICQDIAKLYQKMGQYAGLEIATIPGFSCEPHTGFSGHMWNAVKINGTWKYVDPTWAVKEKGEDSLQDERISSQMNSNQYKKALARRKKYSSLSHYARENRVVGDEWFLTDADLMIETHFPLERQWQLQKTRVIFEDFLQQRCQMTLSDFLNQLNKK